MNNCRTKYRIAEEIIRISQQKKLGRTSQERFCKLILENDWVAGRCGNFGMWWAQKILGLLDWVETSKSSIILECLSSAWFDITLDMLQFPDLYCAARGRADEVIVDHGANCSKASLVKDGDWHRLFASCMDKGPQIRQSFVKHLNSKLALFKNRVDVLVECGKTVARYALEDVDIRDTFLAFIVIFSKKHPCHAIQLVDEALNVTVKAPVSLLHMLSTFLQNISYAENMEKLAYVHKIINDLIEIEEKKQPHNPEEVALMRKTQERLVPHLLGYSPRPPHRAGNESIRVEVFGKKPYSEHVEKITGQVRDVSDGTVEFCARGVQCSADEWDFENVSPDKERDYHGRRITQHAVKAVRRKDNKEVWIEDPDVRLIWPGGELKSNSYSVRGFKYASHYQMPGGGFVLFLTSHPKEILGWQTQARALPEVDYGKSGRTV